MYGVIVETLHPSSFSTAAFCTNTLGVVNCWYLMCTVVFTGNLLSAEASRTAKIYSKLQARFTVTDAQKLNVVYVITQLKSRNSSVENFLFKIDWKVVLAVSVKLAKSSTM